jgi:hypothetical protein
MITVINETLHIYWNPDDTVPRFFSSPERPVELSRARRYTDQETASAQVHICRQGNTQAVGQGKISKYSLVDCGPTSGSATLMARPKVATVCRYLRCLNLNLLADVFSVRVNTPSIHPGVQAVTEI